MNEQTRDQSQKKSSVLEDKEKFGDDRAEEKLSHMGSKPRSSQSRREGSQKPEK
jgi:hypothetical protein